jgi:hypothetical protein
MLLVRVSKARRRWTGSTRTTLGSVSWPRFVADDDEHLLEVAPNAGWPGGGK